MQRRLTNNILFAETQNKIEIIVPIYARLLLNQVLELNSKRSDYPMMAVLKLSIFIHLMPEPLVDTIKNQMEISFNSKQHVKLSKSKYISKEMDANSILTFTYDAKIPTTLRQNSSFLTPFDLKHLETVMTLRSLETVFNHKKTYIRFNFMDSQNTQDKLFIGGGLKTFGGYGIANTYTNVEFSNTASFDHKQPEVVKGLSDNKKLQYWQYAKYTIVLYRHPGFICFQIFFPLWAISLANIFGFLFEGSLSDKNSIATLILTGYLILIVTTTNKNYNSSGVNLIQLNRLLMFLILLLFMVNCFNEREHKSRGHSAYLMLSLGILGSSILSTIALMLMHKLFWEPSYHPESVQSTSQLFETSRWYNQQCDQYYMQLRLYFQQISNLN